MVRRLVRESSLGKNDTILEIGPGKGIITEELLSTSKRVIAVELDNKLLKLLRLKFKNQQDRLTVIHKDFLQYNLPSFPYKVFSNIPFSIEGKIIRKLIDAKNPPADCYLVLRKDLAERLTAVRKESQFSIIHRPWFTIEILYSFHPYDFKPAARMNTVLLRFSKREKPLIAEMYKKKYSEFIRKGFGGGKLLRYNLKKYFSHNQFLRLSNKFRFKIKSKPTDLNIYQWIGIFNYFISTDNSS